MSKIFLHLQKVHDLVHDLEHYSPINHFKNLLKQKDFTAPKIFTGGVNILLWNQLNESEKAKALFKSWYIYYSFRDAKTGKLQRMPNIKGNVNMPALRSMNLTKNALRWSPYLAAITLKYYIC